MHGEIVSIVELLFKVKQYIKLKNLFYAANVKIQSAVLTANSVVTVVISNMVNVMSHIIE